MKVLLLSFAVVLLIMINDFAQAMEGKEMEACRGKGNKTYTHHVPHETDCHKFYKCLGGKGYLKQCQNGLVFNPEEQVCDWEENVPGACDGSNRPSTTSSTSTTTTSTTRPPYPPPPITTSSTTTSPTTTSTTTTSTTTTSTTTQRPIAEGCPVTGKRRLSHETNCHYYYICSDGLKERCRCYEDHRYNPVVGNCDLPENTRCHGEAPVSEHTPKYGLCPPQAIYLDLV